MNIKASTSDIKRPKQGGPVSKSVKRSKALQRITLIGMVLDLALGAAKIVVGTIGHSYGLIADGIHSLSDALSDVLVLVLAHVAGKAPDDDHPYGHGKFETVGSVLMGSLLIGVAGALAWDSVMRLLYATHLQEPEWPVLVVAAISIVSKEWIYRATRKVGEEFRSDLIIANAWHSRTDAFSSIAVLLAAGGAMAGVLWLDIVAAIVIAVLVGHVGWRLSLSGLRQLVETAVPEESSLAFSRTAEAVEGVEGLHFLRARAVGAETLVDVHIQVAPYASASEGHHIGVLTTRALRNAHPEIADVTCHVDIEGNNAELKQRMSVHKKYLAAADKLPDRRQIESKVREQLAEYDDQLVLERLQLHYLNHQVEAELLIRINASSPAMTAAAPAFDADDVKTALASCLQALGVSDIRIWWRG
ncbi:cation diffusion facilitator family transporter [Allohahella marinimesophila]|uniref:Cation diffusion facilitator family transporter n=1 Tax=Allohahella marinimesophila TaxID=1054972 RepID=A0ABP7NN63_9GAMM